MSTVVNGNHVVSIFGYCTFDSNYKKPLPLKKYLLNIIYSPYEGE